MEPTVPAALKKAVAAAVKKLDAGGIAIYPTETFYGIGARIDRPQALARVATLKGRDSNKPMPVIAGDPDAAFALWASVPEEVRQLASRFWPGPLTIVLRARPGLSVEIAPRGEIGVRVSPHRVARELARRCGPLAATSANVSGAGERIRVEQIERSLREQVDVVLDGGETPGGLPSTVIGFVNGVPTILREGAIQRVLVEACLAKRI
jgi:L-threonylcarbamoyladenylate synthase